MTIAPLLADSLADQESSTLALTLRDLGVLAGPLVPGGPSLHRTYTDGTRVIVKTGLDAELAQLARELDGARLARRRGLAAPAPVLADPVASGERWVTVWTHLRPCTPPSLAERVNRAIVQISEVAAAGRGDEPDFDFDYYRSLVNWESSSTELLRRADAAFDAFAAELDPHAFTWIHGDVHLDNQLWLVGGTSVLVDWEWHGRGPVEWDLAKVLRSVLVMLPGYDRFERRRCAALAVELAEAEFAPNWRLVEAIVETRNVTGRTHRPPVPADRLAIELDDLLDAGLIDTLRS